MKPKFVMTPWFPAHTKPVREGVYETVHTIIGKNFNGFSYWDGNKWGYTCTTVDQARQYWGFGHSKKQWRGLLKGTK